MTAHGEGQDAARVEAAGPGLLRFEVHGQAFLWHMVRCLVAIIELVGDGLEAPDVVDALLDVARSPRRPQYALADEAPLVLHDCAFDTVRPAPTPEALLQLHEHLTRERHAARVALARTENPTKRSKFEACASKRSENRGGFHAEKRKCG